MASVTNQVLETLRQKIIRGDFSDDERLTEVGIADSLAVSRTPARAALMALEKERLIERQGGRGFRIKVLSQHDIRQAIEVRAVLEGLAVRQAAEQGLLPDLQAQMLTCLKETDALFDSGQNFVDDYQQLNATFHRLLLEAAGNETLIDALKLIEHVPHASAQSIHFDASEPARERQRFLIAHQQHWDIYRAIVAGASARAEMIMREHAWAPTMKLLGKVP